MHLFKSLLFSALLVFSFQTAHASVDLGNLQAPLDSLGAISTLTESLQKGTPSKLGQLIDENDCERKLVMPDEQAPLQAGDMKVARFSIDVSGAGCPILYHVSLEGSQGADAFSGVIKFSYTSQSDEARALYDVERFRFDGTFSAKLIQIPNGGGLDFTFAYTGDGNSQTRGKFTTDAGLQGKMTMSMGAGAPKDRSAGSSAQPGLPGFDLKIDGGFSEHLKFSFQNESADLASNTVLSGFSPTSEYKINGRSVTAAEYKGVREKIKLPGMEQNPLNGSQPQGSMLACAAETYRASDFTEAQANQWIVAGGTKPAALKVSRSCGNGVWEDAGRVEAQTYTASFTSDTAHSSVRVQICKAGTTCGSTERAFLPDENVTYVDTLLNSYTVLTSCAVVPACAP